MNTNFLDELLIVGSVLFKNAKPLTHDDALLLDKYFLKEITMPCKSKKPHGKSKGQTSKSGKRSTGKAGKKK